MSIRENAENEMPVIASADASHRNTPNETRNVSNQIDASTPEVESLITNPEQGFKKFKQLKEHQLVVQHPLKIAGVQNYPSLGKLNSGDIPSPDHTISHSPIKYARIFNRDLEFNINPVNKLQKPVTTKNSKGTGVSPVFKNP